VTDVTDATTGDTRPHATTMAVDGCGPHAAGRPGPDGAQTTRGGPVVLPPKTLARIAGPLHLLLIVAAAFALSVRSDIVEPDAAATAANIRASATLFRVSFVVDLTANLLYLLTAMALYLLFRHVHALAAAMVTFVAVSVAVGSLNL
jgi:hypothetical protein